MHALDNPLSVIALAALLGWSPAASHRAAARGPLHAAPVASSKLSQVPANPPTQRVQAPPLIAPSAPAPGNPVAIISTSLGEITIELFNDRAPVSVQNFLQYANEGFYDGTIFHRVKPAFMIQGGGFTTTLTEKPTRAPIQNEATNGLRNIRGTVAMARRPQLRSATAQFYINVADNRTLDHTGFSPDQFGYAVFGRVLSGLEIADRIAAVPTHTAGGMDDVPVEPVIINSVRVQK
jgi:cyclophilin family peptidyl-prolyl cis-trans isomerase